MAKRKVHVWKVCGRLDDGRLVSAVIEGAWRRTYRRPGGRRQMVPRCLAFSSQRCAESFALTWHGEVWEAACDWAKAIRWRAEGYSNFAAFSRRKGEPNGWERLDAPWSTVYCGNLRLLRRVK